MWGQRSTSQMKEYNRTLEKQLNKMETSNLPNAEFKTRVTRMINNLSENFNKEIGNIKIKIENIKRNQSEMNTIREELTD